MPLLLDTHVWIWSQVEPERLGPSCAERLQDPEELVHIATVSTLELACLAENGRIEIDRPLRLWVDRSRELLRARTVELSHEIALEAYGLEAGLHRDPADRILVATARRHKLLLVTADERILGWPHVDSLDARAG